MKKYIIYILLVMILAKVVLGGTISTFTTGNQSQNITFTTKDYKYLYIDNPRYSTVDNATFQIKGYSLINYSHIQEGNFANYKNQAQNGCDFMTWLDPQNFTDQNINTKSTLKAKCQFSGSAGESRAYYNWSFKFDKYSHNISFLVETNASLSSFTFHSDINVSIMNYTLGNMQQIDGYKPYYTDNHTFNVTYHSDYVNASNESMLEIFVITWDNNPIITQANYTATIRELMETSDQYPVNPYFEICTITGTKEWNYSGEFDSTESTTNLASVFNANNPACCTGESCTIKEVIGSGTMGIVEITIEDFNYTLHNSTLFVNLYDSDTKNYITNVNITTQFISDIIQSSNVTDTGKTNYSIEFSDIDETVDIELNAFQTSGNDYSIVTAQFNMTQGINKTIDIYLTNTSDTTKFNYVQIRAIDQDGNKLEGAKVNILKRDPATSTFLNISQITTDANGEVSISLETDTVFYKFLVDYDSNRVYTSPQSFPISQDTSLYILNCKIDKDYFSYYNTSLSQTSNIGLRYINVTNISGYFNVDWTDIKTIEVCMYLYKINSTGYHLNSSTCQNGSSGSIDSTTITVDYNVTLWEARVYADSKDGWGERFVKSLSKYIGIAYRQDWGEESLLLPIVAVLISALAFMASSIAGLILLIFFFGVIYATKLTPMQPLAFSFIITLAIFTMITIGKRMK